MVMPRLWAAAFLHPLCLQDLQPQKEGLIVPTSWVVVEMTEEGVCQVRNMLEHRKHLIHISCIIFITTWSQRFFSTYPYLKANQRYVLKQFLRNLVQAVASV